MSIGIGRASGVLATVVLMLVVAGDPASAAVPTPGQVLDAAHSAIAEEPSVHVAFTARSSGRTETIAADIGSSEGSETVVAGNADLTVRVVGGSAYVKGNASGLMTFLGLTSAEAKRVGTKWVVWMRGTGQYSSLKTSVTFSALEALLPKAKGTKLSTAVSDGREVYVLKWTEAATSSAPKLSDTLLLSAGAAPLPLEATSKESNGTEGTTTLSDWGGRLLVEAPPVADTIKSSKVAS